MDGSPDAPYQRGGLVVAALALAAASVAVAVRDSPVHVAAVSPGPDRADAAVCARLLDRLAGSLAGQGARPVTPVSAYTGAWGRPAVTLRCGLRPDPHPEAQGQITLASGASSVTWFEDAFDERLWVTRVAPRVAVELPDSDSFSDVVGGVTDALVASR